MLIIVVSGVFIGMVLGLQGYLVLTTYSAGNQSGYAGGVIATA
ncbi:hypothetical protein ACNKHM_16120 [Shigella sonnei]